MILQKKKKQLTLNCFSIYYEKSQKQRHAMFRFERNYFYPKCFCPVLKLKQFDRFKCPRNDEKDRFDLITRSVRP